MSFLPSPFTRFLARIFDYSLLLGLINIICGVFSILLSDIQFLLLFSLTPLLWIPLETLFLKLWGKTPGKALSGISVVDQRGGTLSLKQAWTRSLIAGFNFLLFLIPGVNIYLFYRYWKNAKNNTMQWDKLSHTTVKGYPSLFRKCLTLILVSGCLLGTYYEDTILEKFYPSSSFHISFSENEKKWEFYTSEDGKFTASFPTAPSHQSQKLPIPRAKITLPFDELTCLSSEGQTFSLSYTVLPSKWLRWKSSLVLKGALKAVNTYLSKGKIIKKQHLSHNNKHPALAYHMKNNDLETIGRLVLVGNHLYKIEMTFASENADSQAIDESLNNFIGSFNIT